jgi:hypothetical protein
MNHEHMFLNLAERYFHATEIQLATLEKLLVTKRAPKCDRRRQRSIVAEMIQTCAEIRKVHDGFGHIARCPRLVKVLNHEMGHENGLAKFCLDLGEF